KMSKNNILQNKNQYSSNIPLNILSIYESYQNPLYENHVNKIVSKFDPVGVGYIHVSKRDDESYYVFDGQHRVAAFRKLAKSKIRGIIYEGMSIVEESKEI